MAEPKVRQGDVRERRSRGIEAARPSASLISTDEAAERLGVTPRFMRRLVDERRIPFHKIGKYVRFDPADIDRFAMESRVDPQHRPQLRSA